MNKTQQVQGVHIYLLIIDSNNIIHQQMEKQNFNYNNKITQRQEYIASVLSSQTFDFICKNSRFIRQELLYFLKYQKYLRSQTSQNIVGTQLNQCMKALMTLLKSLDQEKYFGHFPIFNHILSQYQLLIKKSQQDLLLTNKSKIHTRIQKNQASNLYSFYQKSADSYQEIQKKCYKVNQFLIDLNQNEVVLQDPQCVLCTPVFIHNFKLENKNPYISFVVGINVKKFGVSDLNLQTYVNSVCIQGGGSIIIGAERKEGCLRVKGIRFRDLEEVDRLEQQIQAAIRLLKPTCHFYVERVLVHSHFMESQTLAVSLEEMRFCFRIFIRPLEFNRLHYVQIERRNAQNIIQFYHLNQENQPTKTQPEDNYKKIHEQYYSKLNFHPRNSHRNINCTKRYGYYSKIFNLLNQQGLLDRSQILSESEGEEQSEPKKTITFRYTNLSLLMINSKREVQYIEDLKKALKDNKELFQIIQPFADTFKDSARTVWVISHQVTHSKLRTLINKFRTGGLVKNDAIVLLPISNILQISRSKFTRHVEQILFKRLPSSYLKKQSQSFDNKKHEAKPIIYLKFNSLSQSIFAYMILESLNIKPYFANQEDSKIKF